MSTEQNANNTKNNASQTLFRFVSLRNPQLTETKPEENVGFIHRPELSTGSFDTAIEAWANNLSHKTTKFQELEKVAQTFENEALKTEKAVEELESSYYVIGKSLAKNETPSSELLNTLTNAESKISDGDKNDILSKLWDNLIYQVVTQKDFYVKEAIIQTLKAIHYIDNYELSPSETEKFSNVEEKRTKAKNAKVVLPAKLFVEDAPVFNNSLSTFQVNVSNINEGIIAGDDVTVLKPWVSSARPISDEERKTLALSDAKETKELLAQLQKTLSKQQVSYQKKYIKAYDLAQKNYQETIKPSLEVYQNALLEVEATFDETTTYAQKALARNAVEKPTTPEFSFSFDKEIDAEQLNAKLSNEHLEILAACIAEEVVSSDSSKVAETNSTLTLRFGDKVAILPENDLLTYEEVKSVLSEKMAELDNFIYNNTVVEKEEFVSLGGVLLPVSKSSYSGKTTNNIPCKLFVIERMISGIDTQYKIIPDGGSIQFVYNFNLEVDLSGTGVSISNISYKMITNGVENPQTQYSTITAVGEKYTITKLFGTNSFDESQLSASTEFSAEITLSDGRKIYGTILPEYGFFEPISYDTEFFWKNSPSDGGTNQVTLLPFNYKVDSKTTTGSNYNLDLTLELPKDLQWQIDTISYSLKTETAQVASDSFYELNVASDADTLIFNNLFNTGLDASQYNNAFLDVAVKFNNKKQVVFTTKVLSLSTPTIGTFTVKNIEQTGSGGSSSSPAAFIPKGFGIKRLGIADYLKVEQSLHAYVPGEVSHIENIMAREYKEKSTRRLRRQENTTTSSTDTEREKLTDTTSASRFEMQSEISKMLQESTDFGGHANMKFGGSLFSMDIGANYAHHQAKEESQRQAVTQSQDTTTRALDRIVSKVHEERIEKIIEEYEENNKHGFDNTKGDKHVVGVYRWLDKRMKNQIYNYGKRMMFEFMIPEPAKIHTLGMAQIAAKSNLVKPVDPRKSTYYPLKDYTALSDEKNLKYWLSEYNVEIEKKPEDKILVGKSLKLIASGIFKGDGTGGDQYHSRYFGTTDKIVIPEGYYSQIAYSNASMMYHLSGNEYAKIVNTIGHNSQEVLCKTQNNSFYGADVLPSMMAIHTFAEKYFNEIPVASMAYDSEAEATANFTIVCQLSEEAKIQWQQKAFNAIIKAYEDATREFQSKVDAEKNNAVQIKGSNPGFYRQIENMALRKNCISYMMNRESGSNYQYGKDYLQGTGSFKDEETNLTKEFDQYTAFVKFMEQAFEWDNISYNLYPYYWGSKERWAETYQIDEVDPLFRSFLQAGMGRVIVTVKPGFEDAVNFYMTTGKIWNGGNVPVIGDPMHLSIVDELRETPGKPEGKFWITQIPTSLNMMQEKSIGLVVDTALPLHEEDPTKCENPQMLVKKEDLDFLITNDQIGQTSNKIIQFSWENMDSQPIEYLNFPRVYHCMDQEIIIERDARWLNTDSAAVSYQELADKLSLIDGVYAEVMEEEYKGITLKVDVSKIKSFDLVKPGGSESFDTLKFVTNGVDYISFPNQNADYNIQKISDKNGVNLTGEEVGKKLNLDRFLV